MAGQEGVLPLSVQEGARDNEQSLETDLELQGERVEPAPRSLWRKLADVAFDILTPLPALAWCLTSIVAIALGYSRIGWVTPIVSGIFSSLVSICCAYDIVRYHRRIIYVPIFPGT